MKASWTPGPPLAEAPWLTPLVRDWIADGGATSDVARFLDPAPTGSAPGWSDATWFPAWRDDQLRDRAADADRSAAARHLEALAAGEADVVVTGQQPGYLGGPLYTLLKMAACIAAAEARTRAGRPTVPLYWSGDDDDDLEEALAVRLWDHRRRAFLRPAPGGERPRGRVGALPVSAFGAGELAWLRSDGQAGMAELRDRAAAEGWTRGRFHAAALYRVFDGHGLLTVSGDDAGLMSVAAPLLAEATARVGELADLARTRGEELTAGGHHAQIGDPSLARPLHVAEGATRIRLPDGQAAASLEPSSLRAGVLLRSPLQDWLFRPAAVVVGPGERAYLEQLRPVYEALGVPRPPMLPRLFLRLGTMSGTGAEAVPGPSTVDVDSVLATAREALAAAADRVGKGKDAAAVDRAVERWRGTVERVLTPRARSSSEAREDWRDTDDTRRERELPALWATGFFDELTAILMEASRDHVRRLVEGGPVDYVLDADQPVPEETP